LGELVQIDGSEHWWFEDRGPQSTLLVYVDDATSRLMHLKFVVQARRRVLAICPASRGFDRPFLTLRAICRCVNRSRVRSWRHNRQVSGECWLK
jgi:hypothetical protein